MKRVIWNIVIIIYAIIAITTTICLLSFNEHRISEFGDYSLVIIDSRELEPKLAKGDLLITDKSYKATSGQEVIFYDTTSKDIKVAKVLAVEEFTQDTIYTLEGNKIVSSTNVLGTIENAKQISKLGTVLGILESKWGFLVLIVLPSLIAFLYEIAELVSELRNGSNKK